MASNRWVAIDPDILTHPLVGAGQQVAPADPSRRTYSRMEAWVWMICNASFADHTIDNRGRKMTLQRGDLLGAWAFLAHTFNWSAKTVRAWVENLIADNMLQRRALEAQRTSSVPVSSDEEQAHFYGNQATILSVVNYWRFQFEQDAPCTDNKGNQKGNQFGHHLGNQSSTINASKLADKYVLQEQQGQPTGTPIGQPKGQHITRDIHNKVEESPLPPKGGRKRKGLRTAERALEIDQAVLAYNGAAEQFGFSRVEKLTDQRLIRLEGRLADIGGLENFQLALTAIPHNRFLMGQVRPRQGQEPFRLDFERLLSTGSAMGDVLASLLDQAKGGKTMLGPNGKPWGWWRKDADKIRTLDAAYWRTLIADTKPNGTWPWWILTGPPGSSDCLVHPEVIEELGLAEIYKGRISHG